MNTIDITPIVNAALALIGAGVSVFLIPWLKKQTTEAQRKEPRKMHSSSATVLFFGDVGRCAAGMLTAPCCAPDFPPELVV